jgi:hypothetical protein
MVRNALVSNQPFREWDASVSKIWKFRERFSAQFRAEIFNVTNKPIFATPNNDPTGPNTFGVVTSLNNSGDPILGTGGPRQIAMYLKLIF